MENNQEPQKDKIQTILNKIKNKELDLKPKTYFRLKFAVLILVLVVIAIVSIFFASFIDFAIHASGHTSLVGFGPSGWQLFLILFPWKLFALEVLLIVLFEWLLRSFKFGYKVPVLYLFLGVLGFIVLSGIVVDQTPLHTLLLHQADEHHLPGPFGDLYENVRRPPPQANGIFRGTITNIQGTILMVDLDNPNGIGTTTPVSVTLQNPQSANSVQVGERVFIEGEMNNGQIMAHQVRDANDTPPPRGDH